MLPLVNDAYLTLQPYVPGKPVSETERELGITGAVKLASNENPYGPSPKAIAAIQQYLESLHDYPDGGAYYLKQAIARKHGVGIEQVVVGNGTNDIIDMAVRTFLRPGEKMLYTQPSFVIYKLVAQSFGHEITVVPSTPDLRHDLKALARAVDDRTKLVFLDNPINPTGRYVPRAELEAFLAGVPDDLLVVLDEAYFEFAAAKDYPNGLDYLGRRKRLVVMRTFSKAYGLAGVRVGYGIADAELVDYMNRGRQPFNVSAVAQVAAIAALGDREHVARSSRLNREEMERIVPLLRARGLVVHDSQANFVLVDFGRDAVEVFQALLREGVIIRPLGAYALRTAARVSIGSRPQNDKLLAALGRVLG